MLAAVCHQAVILEEKWGSKHKFNSGLDSWLKAIIPRHAVQSSELVRMRGEGKNALPASLSLQVCLSRIAPLHLQATQIFKTR